MVDATRPSQTVNAALGIVGPTGSGKTSLIATAGEYVWDTFREVLHLATADGGGFPTKVQALVNVGVIRVWRMRTRGEAFETTIRASQGWWPTQINPRTGETPPNVRLVPPITERYVMRCPNGHVIKTVAFQSLLTPAMCVTCKTHTTKETMLVERSATRTKGFEQVGAQALDGLTSFLNWQMEDMGNRHARMELKGEETSLGGRIVSGDLVTGGNNRAHFGFVQGKAESMVNASNGIPYLRIPPIWTGLMLETVDEGGLSIAGMKLVGKAKTDEAGSWFGNMLEVGVVKDVETGQDVRRLSLNEFTDDRGVRHLIKHRGGPSMPPYLQDTPGNPWSQVHLGVFFDLLAKDVEDQNAAAGERYKDAPGVTEAMTFGEPPVETGDRGGLGVPLPTPALPLTTSTPGAPRPAAPKPRVTAPKPRTQVKPTTAAPPVQVSQDSQEVAHVDVAAETAPEVVAPEAPPAQATSPAPAPAPVSSPPVATTTTTAQTARPAPGPRPVIAPPPGPRPPAVAPRRPAPRPAAPPPVPVGSK